MKPEIIKESIQAVIDGFAPLAEKLKIPSEKLFTWAIKENYVIAITSIFYIFPIIIGWFFEIKFINMSDDNIWTILSWLVGITLSICSMLWFFSIQEILGRLIVPEYHALLDLISQLKDKKNEISNY